MNHPDTGEALWRKGGVSTKAQRSDPAGLVAGSARRPEKGTEEGSETARDEVSSEDTTEKQQTTARKEIFIMYV